MTRARVGGPGRDAIGGARRLRRKRSRERRSLARVGVQTIRDCAACRVAPLPSRSRATFSSSPFNRGRLDRALADTSHVVKFDERARRRSAVENRSARLDETRDRLCAQVSRERVPLAVVVWCDVGREIGKSRVGKERGSRGRDGKEEEREGDAVTRARAQAGRDQVTSPSRTRGATSLPVVARSEGALE